MNTICTPAAVSRLVVSAALGALLLAAPAMGDVAPDGIRPTALPSGFRSSADVPPIRASALQRTLPSIVRLAMTGGVRPPDMAAATPQEMAPALRQVEAPRDVLAAVLEAAARTGVDPAYLCALADKESGWSRDARSSSSSAVGLFQFLEATWLRMVKSHGAAWGLESEADAISIGAKGPLVADAGARRRILEMRRDPWYSAILAAEMLKRDRALVGERLGREISASEAYLAHFLGPAGAGRILTARRVSARAPAARLLPASARANRSLFYERKRGRMHPLGVAEFFGRVDRLIGARVRRYAAVSAPAVQ